VDCQSQENMRGGMMKGWEEERAEEWDYKWGEG
jgi:hypothetical protein